MQAPRTWGWTKGASTGAPVIRAGPTHVGMDRCDRDLVLRLPRRPHARGEGPGDWNSYPYRVGAGPTHVGMDRTIVASTLLQNCRPHARRDGPAMFRAGSDGGSQAWERHQTWQHRGGTPMSCANAPPVWSWKPARTRPHETEQSPAPRTSSASTARPCATGWSRPRSMPETGPAPPPTRPNAWPSWSAKCTSCAGPTRS